MRKRNLIEISPIAILTILGIYSIIQVLVTDYLFSEKQYIGLALLGVSFILFFTNRRIYKYIFGLTLLLGLVNLVDFTTSVVTINIMFIPIQIMMIPLLGIYVWINKDKIYPKLRFLIGNSKVQIETDRKTKVEVYRRRFKELSDHEIVIKLNQSLVPEAHEALKQIKIERN